MQMTEKYRVIDGFDFANNPCKLIEDTKTTEQYNTENELEANSLCKLLNEQEERIKQLETELSDMTQRFGYELKMKLKYHSKLIECEKKGDVE